MIIRNTDSLSAPPLDEGDRDSTDEKLFWRGVGPRMVKAAFLRYRDDFDIFGYDIGRYFRRLGLKS